jgi:hypothetical protein
MDASEQLIYSLVDEFSECRPLLTEHLVDMEGELLPYLLLGDVVRWACQQSPSDPDRVSALVRWLEHRFEHGDGEVKDLVGVGFVEMLPHTPVGDPVLTLLGPTLSQLADEMGLLLPPESSPEV